MEPANCVYLILDLFERHEPFGDRVVEKGTDTVAEEAFRPGVDHIVP